MARPLPALALLGAVLALAAGRTAHAQEVATVSVERPSQDAALAFLEVVWDHLPEEGGVAFYLSCARPDCSGQVPGWFSRASWEVGLGEAGDYSPAPDLGVSPERVAELRLQHPAPADLAAGIARELAAVGQTVTSVLLIYPGHRGDEKLELSWQLVDLSVTTGRDPLGRLTVRLPPPPPPLPPPPGPPWRSRPVVWAGAGLLAAGSVVAVASSAALLEAEPGQQPHSALTTTAAAGWLAVMAGGSMMVVPAIHSHSHGHGLGLALHLRR